MNPAHKEFRAKPYVVGLVGLYVTIVLGYGLGGLVIGVFLLAVVGHFAGQFDIGAIAMEGGGWARVGLLGASALLLCVSARGAQRAIRGAKRVCVTIDGSAVHSTDRLGRRRAVQFRDIVELRVGASWWLGRPAYVITREQRARLSLPSTLENRDALLEEVVQRAALVNHYRDGRWEIYRRSKE